MRAVGFLLSALVAASCGLSVSAAEPTSEAEGEMAAIYLKMGIAENVFAEAGKLAGTNAAVRGEIGAAAQKFRSNAIGDARRRLMALYPDEQVARKEYGAFVERFAKTATAETRSAIVKRKLSADIASAGKFLSEVQAWLRVRAKEGNAPSLAVWLNRDQKVSAPKAEVVKKKPKRKANPLRDAEADAGTFVEAKDDGASSLRSFGALRKSRRDKLLSEAQQGMEQVAAERRVADEAANAKKLAAAQAEAAAQQAHAQRLAAVEQEATVQDQNSWKTRLKGVVSTAIGATAGAFAGSVGSHVGQAAADAVLGNKR